VPHLSFIASQTDGTMLVTQEYIVNERTPFTVDSVELEKFCSLSDSMITVVSLCILIFPER
jgi:hypothetical protein